MKNEGIPIFWDGQHVGRIQNPVVDNFRVHGDWIAESSQAARDFLSAIAAITDDDESMVWVTSGSGFHATVEFLGREQPHQETRIEIIMRAR